MTSNDRLEELKKQVRDTSNQQSRVREQIAINRELVSRKQEEKEHYEKEMVQLVRNVFCQSEISAYKDRELIQDKLDKFAHRQTVMNEQLITLNDNLTDLTSLQAVYQAKREQLEADYKNLEKILQEKVDSLTYRSETLKGDLRRLEEEIGASTSKLEEIALETKKATFWYELKKNWINKWVYLFCVCLVFFVLGAIIF